METKPGSAGPAPDTSTTLLDALSAAGAPAAEWTRFVRLYGPVVRIYLAGLRRAGPWLDPDWDDDIAQEALGYLELLMGYK